MKINEEYYIKFIEICIKQKIDNVVSSNQIHSFFCAIFDLDPLHFSIKAFMPKFLAMYEKIKGIKLEKVKKRVNLRGNTMRGIKGISIDRIILDSNINFLLAPQDKIISQNDIPLSTKKEIESDVSSLSTELHQEENSITIDWKTFDTKIKNWLLKSYKVNSSAKCLVSDMLDDFTLYFKLNNLDNTGGRVTYKILTILKETFPENEIKRIITKKRQNGKQISIPIIIGLEKIN